MVKIHYRHPFTLLELLISLGLTVLLLTTLSFFYQQVSWLDQETERVQKENFQVRYLETRLNKVLPNTLAEYEMKEGFLFYTGGDLQGLLSSHNPSLVFLFNNGISMDAKRANRVLARLYLDKEKNLTLAIWPLPKKWEKEGGHPSVHKEVLIDHIESIQFQFFVPPERDRKIIQESIPGSKVQKNTEKENPPPPKGEKSQKAENNQPPQTLEPTVKGDWVGEWKKEYGYLPPLMKLIITRKKEGQNPTLLTYTIPLSHSQKLIIYEQ